MWKEIPPPMACSGFVFYLYHPFPGGFWGFLFGTPFATCGKLILSDIPVDTTKGPLSDYVVPWG